MYPTSRLGSVIFILSSSFVCLSFGAYKRCYVCRSRGPLGDCKDPFSWNGTSTNDIKSIETSPCASGWCGKAVEGKEGDHLRATERMCLQLPPTDREERCSETFYQHRKEPLFMCFCRGDLCNRSPRIYLSGILALFSIIRLILLNNRIL